MNKCTHRSALIDYIYNELRGEEQALLGQHIKECQECEATLDELREAHQLLASYKRNKPSRERLKAYHRELENLYKQPLRGADWWESMLQLLVVKPSIPVRLAEVAVIFMLGIWIGQGVFTPSRPLVENVSTKAAVDNAMLEGYLANAEMLLLDVANIENEKELSYILSESNCSKMLQKTTLLKEQAQTLQRPVLENLLDQLELILLELANCDGAVSQSELKFIQEIIRDSHVMVEIQSLNTI